MTNSSNHFLTPFNAQHATRSLSKLCSAKYSIAWRSFVDLVLMILEIAEIAIIFEISFFDNSITLFAKEIYDSLFILGCTRDGCDKSHHPMKIKDFINHLNKECLTVNYTCPNQCGETFQFKKAMSHYEKCKNKELKCQFCHL